MAIPAADKMAHQLFELFKQDWAGMGGEGATQISVEPRQQDKAQADGLSFKALEQAGLLENKGGIYWWEFKTIMERAAAYERENGVSETRQPRTVQF